MLSMPQLHYAVCLTFYVFFFLIFAAKHLQKGGKIGSSPHVDRCDGKNIFLSYDDLIFEVCLFREVFLFSVFVYNLLSP